MTAFKATIAEAIDADLTLVLLDTSDSLDEIRRKLDTTRREVLERQENEPDLLEDTNQPHVVLTKIDKVSPDKRKAVAALVGEEGFPAPVAVSSHTGEGVDALQLFIREQLFGASVSITVFPPTSASPDASERIVSEVYDRGMVDDDHRETDGSTQLEVWMTQACQAQLKARWADRIDIK